MVWRGAASGLLSLATIACSGGGDTQRSNVAQGFQQGQPGGAPYAPAYAAPPPPPVPQQGAPSAQPAGAVQPLGAVSSDSSALQNIIAGALAGGAASFSMLTGGELGPIEQGIKQQAQAHARGMKPEGQLMSARLQAGGHAQGTLLLQPGVCYTIVGFAGLGVFKYQINVLTAPPTPPTVVAQSSADGVTPVVGPSEQCLRNPYPLAMQVKVDMHVVQGQGMVGAQAYKR